MKWYSWQLIVLICFLVVSGCSRDPLRDKSPEERFRIVWELRWGEPDKIPILLRALKDDEKSIRRTATESLGYFNQGYVSEEKRKEVISALISVLKDDEWIVRESAINSLAEYGPYAREAIPHIALALNDTVWQVRWTAAFAIVDIDPFAKEVIPILQEVLENETNEWARLALEEAIITLGGEINSRTEGHLE